jgi:hypothetical protein
MSEAYICIFLVRLQGVFSTCPDMDVKLAFDKVERGRV